MPKKAITKKYLLDRCSFENQTVIKALKHDALWLLIKQMDVEDQHAIFKVVEHTVTPLTEIQIDSLFAYLSHEVREGLDMISMTKEEKLNVVRDNKAVLKPVIEKNKFTDKLKLDSQISVPQEEFSSSKLWNIIKSGKYSFE